MAVSLRTNRRWIKEKVEKTLKGIYDQDLANRLKDLRRRNFNNQFTDVCYDYNDNRSFFFTNCADVPACTDNDNDLNYSNSYTSCEYFNEWNSLYESESEIELNECTKSQKKKEKSLITDLKIWAIEGHVSHTVINNLLHILPIYVNEKLPKDARTLLNTEKKSCISIMGDGKFTYFGLINGIQVKLKSGIQKHVVEKTVLSLHFNIDGLPLYSSSSIQLWPILCLVKETNDCKPFVVCAYLGTKKPEVLSEYFRQFIQDLVNIFENGILYNNVSYRVPVSNVAFICDKPAKSFVKGTKGHTGYFSCDNCTQEGVWYKHRMIFSEVRFNHRTDSSFLTKQQPEHHLYNSPLLDLGLGMVSQFPIDYMHCACLGVMKRLLKWWMQGNLLVRWHGQLISNISNKILEIQKYVPCEFNRKLRCLKEKEHWKATEFRLFLLYVGPVILNDRNISHDVYKNFLLFSCAIFLLVSSNKLDGITLAENLLKAFVTTAEKLYGKEFVSYYVHALVHLPNDAKKYGTLDQFSAFPFENHLCRIKSMLRTGHKPLEQLSRRFSEDDCLVNNHAQLSDEPKLLGCIKQPFIIHNKSCNQYTRMLWKKCTFKNEMPNNICILADKKVFRIEHFVKLEETIFVIGRKFSKYDPIYSYPILSTDIDCFIISDLENKQSILTVNEICGKMVVFPMNNKFAALRIAHTLL